MADSVIIFFVFSSSLIAFIIALGELVQKNKTFVDYIFLLSFFGLSCWYLQLSFYATGIYPYESVRFYILSALAPVAFAVPPLMSNRYRWIITNRHAVRKKYLFVFIPSIISLVIVSLPLFVPALRYNGNLYFNDAIISSRFYELPLYFKIVYSMVPLESVYLIFMMIPVLTGLFSIVRNSRGTVTGDASTLGYIFASLITFSNFMAVAGLVFYLPFLKFAILFSTAVMTGLYLVTQRHPDYNRLLRNITRKHNYEKSQIKGLNIAAVKQRLLELMEDEKIFADEDLSLASLADELGISPHQLSEILNREIGKNFSTFVNEYRIKEAMQYLIDEPDRSILSIGVAVGFNSATTFNSVFSRSTGMTPGRYRRVKISS